MLVSVVIRTFNEAKHLNELLQGIQKQKLNGHSVETVVIDSGSTDDTLSMAETFGCRITHIDKAEFTFGRSLNMGSAYAKGDVLVYVSGHCIPVDEHWLENLISPIASGICSYSYGKQIGRDTTKYSEVQLFKKYFPDQSKLPQEGFFINNANAAIARSTWEELHFDEEVTGLEDMELAKRLVAQGGRIAYVANACVYHIHDETWAQTKRRYEREAIALQKIMPEVHVHWHDTIRYLYVGISIDMMLALREKCLMKEFFSIIKFRFAQYLGSYFGNHEHRALSKERKEQYYYPNHTL